MFIVPDIKVYVAFVSFIPWDKKKLATSSIARDHTYGFFVLFDITACCVELMRKCDVIIPALLADIKYTSVGRL